MPEGEYGDIETAAKDFVRKLGITAGDDLENLTSLLGEGTNKLQGKTNGIDEVLEQQLTEATGAIRNYLNG